MELSNKILSDVIIYCKYSKYLPDLKRRETWEETVTRNKEMHIKKFPSLKEEIEAAYRYIYDKKILPSMRSLQFAGKAAELNPARLYNCAYAPIDNWEVFSEIMFLLLSGCGVGYSVQNCHIKQLPEIKKPRKVKRFLINDSIEGWADAVKVLLKAYFLGTALPNFDFSDIRPKGTELKTSGGKAPGPEPLIDCLHNVKKVIDRKEVGDKLSPLEAHDILCYIADAVLAGGIRRSSSLSLFSIDDEDMLTCKFGNWWENNPQRARANNSACLLRHKIKKKDFSDLWKKIELSKSGEPGVYFSNDKDAGCNPCIPAFTDLLTPYGIRQLKNIQIGDTIWSETGWTKVINKCSTGTKPIYCYRTRCGMFIGTDNHQIVSNGVKLEVKHANSIDLLRGPNYEREEIDYQCIMDGLMIGDGSIHLASKFKVYLEIGNLDGDYHSYFPKNYIIGRHAVHYDRAWKVQTTVLPEELPELPHRIIPERYYMGSVREKLSFLRGLYSANGSICGNRVTLKSTCLNLIDQVQTMLSSVGISSYYTINKPSEIEWANGTYTSKESYDLNICSDRHMFRDLIGFIQGYKVEKLNKICEKPVSKTKETFEIREVDYLGDEEVFDITVDNETHTFWNNGLNISNCNEISLRPFGFCNLVEVNVSNVESQDDLNNRCRAAAFIGTLQASYTNFHYLRECWKEAAEADALIGVGMTGIGSGAVLNYNEEEAANVVLEENARVAKHIGINKAARTTTIKPAGTTSLVLGCSSGIHAWHGNYYIRRITLLKNEALYLYLLKTNKKLIEDDPLKPTQQALICIPQKAPKGSIIRDDEGALDLLERVKRFSTNWVRAGHRRGSNTNNVSATISIKNDEWESVGEWMWENKDYYNGLSVLPYSDSTYVQAPFETITKDQYYEMEKLLKEIDLTKVTEYEDNTSQKDQAACAGGVCEII